MVPVVAVMPAARIVDVVVAAKLNLIVPSTSQSPAVRETEVMFIALGDVNETVVALPLIYSPSLPAAALSFVAVGTIDAAGNPVAFVSTPEEGVPSAPLNVTGAPALPTLAASAVATPVPNPAISAIVGTATVKAAPALACLTNAPVAPVAEKSVVPAGHVIVFDPAAAGALTVSVPLVDPLYIVDAAEIGAKALSSARRTCNVVVERFSAGKLDVAPRNWNSPPI
jgi:hypothetical protein